MSEHPCLSDDDDCYFLWEWSGEGYATSATSDFIGNFQRETRFRDRGYPWDCKLAAITHAANALRQTLPASWKANSTFIPMPPSKTRIDPRFDSRLVDVLRRLKLADVRDMVDQAQNGDSRQKGISVSRRRNNLKVNNALLMPIPSHIVIFDDILSGGSHFAAMKRLFGECYPDVPMSGVFLARRVVPPIDQII